jgi:hypothetical protein
VRPAASARQQAAVPADAAPLVAMRLHVHDIRIEAGPWTVGASSGAPGCSGGGRQGWLAFECVRGVAEAQAVWAPPPAAGDERPPLRRNGHRAHQACGSVA